MWNGNWCSCTNINTEKNIKGSMEQQYPKSTRWDKNIMLTLHIHGALTIFKVLCNNQDIESELWDMEIGVAGPIFTKKNIKGSMGQWYQ